MQDNANQSNQPRYWAVIPAAGIGRRMASECPKQYLPLAGKTVIEHSLNTLLSHASIAGAVVAISPQDTHWQALDFRTQKPLWIASGGQERGDSVLNALHLLAEHASDTDWVLVHDAARPCLRHADLSALIQQCQSHLVGGLLAVPVKDTIKRSVQQDPVGLTEVVETVERNFLWHAQTPQMFRLGALLQALSAALKASVVITDEASAMEWAGNAPLLVEGHDDNLKITRADDLRRAEFILGLRTEKKL